LYGSVDRNTIQSCNHCYPIKLICHGESKETMKEFNPLIEVIMKLNVEPIEDGYQTMDIAVNSDLACTQNLVDKGGPFKQVKYGCHLCAEAKWWVGDFNGEQCLFWCTKLHGGDAKWKCFHFPSLTKENVEELQEQIQILLESLGETTDNLKSIHERTSVRCEEDSRGVTDEESLMDINSIDFDALLRTEKPTLKT
jgi:hypothetical protein